MKNIIVYIIILITFTSCEKIISLDELDLNANQSKIVIEGNITNESGPYYVKITGSNILSSTDANPTIDNAEVTINDNVGNTEKLTFIGNGLYETKQIEGSVGRTYTLTAVIDNQTYKAESTMPELVILDDIIAKLETFGGDTTQDLTPQFLDPISKGDTYRFILKLNDKLIKKHFIINDNVANGSVNIEHLSDLDDKIESGDVINLTMQHIDRNVGLYFSTLVLISDSGPGGGATPTNPPNNISNGALGVFSAHTVSNKTIVIQ